MNNTGNAELNYCYNCMTRLESGQTICPECGHDNTIQQNPESALPEGTMLAGKYLVGKVLGQGGFGITYLGFDTSLDVKVAVKEYFPVGIGIRSSHSIRVTAVSSQGKAEGFRKGCDEFQSEAKRLAAIDSPNIVKVRDYFRENGTAYIIMNYLDGRTLTKEVSVCGGKIPWNRVVELFKPLILELDKLHKAHLIHRDIKPDNLKIVKDDEGAERLALLDFGAARSFVSSEVTGTYSAMVTHGYAPMEQYSPKSKQGPYTDIYALCATMYAVITGTLPATAPDRVTGSAEIRTFSEMGVDMPEPIEKAIFHGLEMRSVDRPQTMRELYDELEGKEPAAGGNDVSAENQASEPRAAEKPEAERKLAEEDKPKKKTGWILPVLLAVLAAAVFFLYRGIHQNQLNTAGTQTAEAGISTQSALELAERSTQEGRNTQTAQAGMTEQAEAAGTQTARETQEALHAEQTGTAWNLTAAAELQQTQTQAAADARATQAEQESRAEQTVQVETQWALNTEAALQSEQTATAWFTTQEAQLHQTQTREAEDLRGTAAALEQTRVMAEQQTATQAAAEALLTRTVIAEQTAGAEQTLAAMDRTREALEAAQTEIAATQEAFYLLETQNVWQQTQDAVQYAQTQIAGTQNAFFATQTKAAEPTATPTLTATAAPKPEVKVGDIFTLGHYEQDGDTNNGPEAIEWQVLAVEDGRALVISKYGLDAKPYNETWIGLTWETSTLRSWLNTEFYNRAFTESEKEIILQETLKNPKNSRYKTNGGRDTEDLIFLLSISEAEKYFSDDNARKSSVTAYGTANNAFTNYDRNTWWWLRSPGNIDKNAAVVNANGRIIDTGYTVENPKGTVRPAFWMDLNEETNVVISTATPTPEAVSVPKLELNIGDIFTLGHYEQDGNTANGPEAIEWQVLAVEDSQALVISKYAVDAKPYNEERAGVTWKKCTLRNWLNGEFFNSAFSNEEKGSIREVTLKNPDNGTYGTKGGKDTTDRIFLLSADEAKKYFANDGSRQCSLTTYAENNGAFISEKFTGMAWWWLRSPGYNDLNTVCVDDNGRVYDYGYFVNLSGYAVRPAFWLDLNKGTDVIVITEIPISELSDGTDALFDLGEKAYNDGDYEKALENLLSAAEAGHPGAQFRLGFMYENGHGLEKSYEEAVKWYQLSADQGYADAQYNLGAMYASSHGVKKSNEEAARWIRLAADQGYALAQYNLGRMYEYGNAVEQSYEEAQKWYQLAADQGDVLAQKAITALLKKHPELKNTAALTATPTPELTANIDALFDLGKEAYDNGDYEKALEHLLPAAEAGHPGAQFRLGVMYQNGRGAEKSYEKAVKWYQLAAAQGNAAAQRNLGLMYQNGLGVDKSYEAAVKWYRLAADQGYGNAQIDLGYMYEKGYGVDQSYEEAMKLYQLAAEQGISTAQFNLGVMYYFGRGVDQSHEEAARWFQHAADQGLANAQYNLGIMYEIGDGVEKSYEEAAKWYKLAADQGYEPAQGNLKNLLEKHPELKKVIENTAEPTAVPAPIPTNTPKITAVTETGDVSDPGTAQDPDVRVGDIITLGSYEQDSNLGNGKEPIEWQVLAVENGRALVISRYTLEMKYYNETNTSVTWETSTIRKWLNGEFFENSFTTKEKARILQVTNKNPDYEKNRGGNDTKDRVFLLSLDEVEMYFEDSVARSCEPTKYTRNRGGSGDWWLRSPGKSDSYCFRASYVGGNGTLGNLCVNSDSWSYRSVSVRPAFWLDLIEHETVSKFNLTVALDIDLITEEDQAIVVTDTLLLNKPASDGTILRSVLAGKTVFFTGKAENNYVNIRTAEGQEGWIPESSIDWDNFFKIIPSNYLKKGQRVIFGAYEQDNNQGYAPEALEWQVLSVEDGRALMISRYGLDAKPYNKERISVTWETCTLRTWLNGEFFNSAFSSEEKGHIREITIKNPDNATYGTKGGNDTTDRIFLLSSDEAAHYFADNTSRLCVPMAYENNNGALDPAENGDAVWWWLRSPGGFPNCAAYVTAVGGINYFGDDVYDSEGVVRPAFWLDL